MAAVTATTDSSGILPRAGSGETVSSLCFTFLSLLACLHFPHVTISTCPTGTSNPLLEAHDLHILNFGQQVYANSSFLCLTLQLVHFVIPGWLVTDDPPSEDTSELASAP